MKRGKSGLSVFAQMETFMKNIRRVVVLMLCLRWTSLSHGAELGPLPESEDGHLNVPNSGTCKGNDRLQIGVETSVRRGTSDIKDVFCGYKFAHRIVKSRAFYFYPSNDADF